MFTLTEVSRAVKISAHGYGPSPHATVRDLFSRPENRKPAASRPSLPNRDLAR
jgi:hypothetical protein